RHIKDMPGKSSPLGCVPAGSARPVSACMRYQLVDRLREKIGRGAALAEHDVVLQEAEIADRRGDLLLLRPVGRRIAFGRQQEIAVYDAVAFVQRAQEARIVRMRYAG